ncbi:MAG: dTDP-4-dehydrorhamnose 3,5-epimerase [Chitinophagaceae bacterium]|jgi:dTDP-4-dehydrorhamnose 3,5-epimerase|nr:dTDP-4-dehydrorhamnose 3,5-epimerase [Chitinophagaceae bacterium]
MEIITTPLNDCFIIKPTLFEDARGYFFESFNRQKFNQLTGIDIDFVQDNQAKSNYGILRGLHFQQGEHAQAKLVSVIKGKVIDVAVDMRPESSTYLQHIAIELSEQNHLQLFVPRGFAHGYSVLEDNTIFFYKCDNYYHKASEGGVIYNDPTLNIDWQLDTADMLLSEKDVLLPRV